MTEYSKGAASMRDLVLAYIIGLQNDMGNDTSSEGYQSLQKLSDIIVERHGDYASPCRM